MMSAGTVYPYPSKKNEKKIQPLPFRIATFINNTDYQHKGQYQTVNDTKGSTENTEPIGPFIFDKHDVRYLRKLNAT